MMNQPDIEAVDEVDKKAVVIDVEDFNTNNRKKKYKKLKRM